MKDISKKIINFNQNKEKIIIPINEKKIMSIEDGYTIQNEVYKHYSKTEEYNSWKIGCTTNVMQKYLKIPSPCLGRVKKKETFEGNSIVDYENYIRPGVECEIAVILSKNFDYYNKGNNHYNLIEKVVPCIEIVDDRWPDYKNENTPILIADNFFASSLVFGKGSTLSNLEDLRKLRGKMSINNKLVGEGTGKDILGDPLNALDWFLSFNFNKDNHPKAGDLISLGSLVQTQWVQKNDKVKVEIEKIGNVEVKFN